MRPSTAGIQWMGRWRKKCSESAAYLTLRPLLVSHDSPKHQGRAGVLQRTLDAPRRKSMQRREIWSEGRKSLLKLLCLFKLRSSMPPTFQTQKRLGNAILMRLSNFKASCRLHFCSTSYLCQTGRDLIFKFLLFTRVCHSLEVFNDGFSLQVWRKRPRL